MAGESKNLLTRTLATVADKEMQLYVVFKGYDYRIQLDTMLSLISKASLGLDRVNNTSDAEKPLSLAATQALELKADKANVVTRAEWDAFIQNFTGVIDLSTLQNAVDQLSQAVQNAATMTQVEAAINTALAPIRDALSLMQLKIDSLTAAQEGFASKQDLINVTDLLTTRIGELDNRFEAYRLANDTRVTAIEERLSLLEASGLTIGPNFW